MSKNPFDYIKEPVPTIKNRPRKPDLSKAQPGEVELIVDGKKYFYDPKVVEAERQWQEKRMKELRLWGM